MKTRNLTIWVAAASLFSGLALTAQAAPLVINGESMAQAAAELSAKYDVNIVYKGDFGPPKDVTFTVDDADSPGGRLQAINALANAVGADFTKTYVVSKVTEGETAPTAQIDSRTLMTFPSKTMPVQDAISLIASTDSASAQIVGTLNDTVTFSDQSLTASQAADEVAKQTNTRWKTFYALVPRGNGRVTGGKIIGRTSGGQAITELPFVYYTHPKSAAQLQQEAEAAQQQSNQEAAAQQQQDLAAQQQQQQMMAQNGMAQNGMAQNGTANGAMMQNGYNGYGYGNNGYGYGNNGYGYSNNGYGNGYGGYGNSYGNGYGGYGNGGYNNGGNYGNGLILQPGAGNGYGYGNGPIIFGGVGY